MALPSDDFVAVEYDQRATEVGRRCQGIVPVVQSYWRGSHTRRARASQPLSKTGCPPISTGALATSLSWFTGRPSGASCGLAVPAMRAHLIIRGKASPATRRPAMVSVG